MAKVKKCCLCEEVLDKDSVGLNKKLLDPKITRFMCIKCLSSHFDVPTEELYEKIDEFKSQGCTLFL